MPALKKTGTQTEALIQAQVILLENEIISRSEAPDRFRLLSNQYNLLQSWHDLHTGWRIHRTPASIRLIRTPISFVPGYVFRTLRQPRDFACLVWTLWYAETRLTDTGGHANAQQFLMSQLAERLEEQSATGYLPPHAAPFDFRRQSDRYSLLHALKTLEELGGLQLQDGSSEEWVNQAGQENALYEFTEVTRSLILALDMEQVRAAGQSLQGNPHSLAPVRLPGAERLPPLQRAWRTLLLGPALLKYDDPEAFAELRQHQETFQFEVGEAYGWQLDLRYEYAMIVRPSGTGLAPNGPFNLTGAVDQAALLCCQRIRQKVENEWHYPLNDGCLVVPEGEIAEIFRQVRERDGSRWGSTARKTSFQELLKEVYAKLRLAGLVRGPDRNGRMLILPTLARFNVSYPPEEAIPASGSPLQEQGQQLFFAGAESAASPELSGGKTGQAASTGLVAAAASSPAAGQTALTGAEAAASYNTAQTGRLLGVSQQSVSRWLGTGFIKGERSADGRGWLVPAAEIERIRKLRYGNAAVTASPVASGESAEISPSTSLNSPPVPNRPASASREAAPNTKAGQADLDLNADQNYNAYEAARLLGVSGQTVLNWLKKGKISGERIGTSWSIPAAEIARAREFPPANSPATVSAVPPAPAARLDNNNPARGYNTYEAARLVGVNNVTILDWLKKGKISGAKIGPNWSIPPAEIERVKEVRQNSSASSLTRSNYVPPSHEVVKTPPAVSVNRVRPGPDPNREQGYNTHEAARLLGVADQTVLNWLKKGKIRGERIGTGWSIPTAEIARAKDSYSDNSPGAAMALPTPPVAPLPDTNADNNLTRGYNTVEAGRLLGVSDPTILNWLKKGKIRGEKTGLSWSISQSEIERLQSPGARQA